MLFLLSDPEDTGTVYIRYVKMKQIEDSKDAVLVILKEVRIWMIFQNI